MIKSQKFGKHLGLRKLIITDVKNFFKILSSKIFIKIYGKKKKLDF